MPPRRIEIPEKCASPEYTRLSTFLTAPETCWRDIGRHFPLSCRKLGNNGGQRGHRAAGRTDFVQSLETAKPRLRI